MTHVLVGVDFSVPSGAALDYGCALARGLGGRLTVLHVVPYYPEPGEWPGVVVRPSADAERWQSLLAETQAFVARCPQPVPSIVLREGDPADEILEWAAANEVTLVVLGTHGRRGLRRFMPGSVTERVARTAPCPVVAVPRDGEVPFDRVLCAVDLTEDSPETVAHAATVAQAVRAHLILLHAVAPPPPYEPWMIPPRDDATVRRRLEDSARVRLATLVAPHARSGLTVELRVIFGRASEEIERAARHGVALTVLGVRTSRAVERFFFGSTARHVLRAAASAVLLVPHRVVAPAPHEDDREKALVDR